MTPAARAMRRGAIRYVIIALLLATAFTVLAFHYLPIWFAVLGWLVAAQAIGLLILGYVLRFDLARYRRYWLQLTVAESVWSLVTVAVAAQISTLLAVIVVGDHEI
jgi:hypothetical protein